MPHRFPLTTYFNDVNKTYTVEFQTSSEYSVRWQNTLAAAYKKYPFHCTCLGTGDKRLSVRYYQISDRYDLAKFGETGEQHDSSSCVYFSENPQKSGLGGYLEGVVCERDDGGLKIKLEIGLLQKHPTLTSVPELITAKPAGQSRSQPAIRLLGLLHLLWCESGLNRWWPKMAGKRTHHKVNELLRRSASNITCSPLKLDTVLLLAANAPYGTWADHNRAVVAKAKGKNTRLLVVAELAAHTPDTEARLQTTLELTAGQGIPILDMPWGLWDAAVKSFPRANTAWRDGERIQVISEIELKDNPRYANVIKVALMAVTNNWIPFDSSHEQVIAEKLITEARAFIKPLRYDASADRVFPDFILQDTQPPAPLEVFGRTDEKYMTQVEAKTTYYNAVFSIRGWWCWHAVADPKRLQIPPFPPKATPWR